MALTEQMIRDAAEEIKQHRAKKGNTFIVSQAQLSSLRRFAAGAQWSQPCRFELQRQKG